jgi:SAM-dependent methyltransferase
VPFVVPPRFLRNAANVLALGPPADVGRTLVDYMARRIGVPDLAGLDVLDVGCGTRFADMLMNRDVPVGSYTGIDVNRPIIEFLQAEATDPRLAFHHFDAYTPLYNPDGVPMTAVTPLPVGERRFDVICMFSVITHQLPADAQALFAILRRYVRPDGHLFFSCCLDDESGVDYGEAREKPTGLSLYSTAHMRRLLEASGWKELSLVATNPEGLPVLDTFLCAPA